MRALFLRGCSTYPNPSGVGAICSSCLAATSIFFHRFNRALLACGAASSLVYTLWLIVLVGCPRTVLDARSLF